MSPTPLEMRVEPALTGRDRLSVAFRIVLVIPHVVVVVLLIIPVIAGVIAGWFAGIVSGRVPAGIWRFLAQYVGYNVQVAAYLNLLSDRYPRFGTHDDTYPVRIEVEHAPAGRLALLVRAVPGLAALLLASAAGSAGMLAAILSWFAIVFTGRHPRSLYAIGVVVQRYTTRAWSYIALVSGVFPWGLLGDRADASTTAPAPADAEMDIGAPDIAPSAGTDLDAAEQHGAAADDPSVDRTDPSVFVLAPRAKALLIVFILLGALVDGATYGEQLRAVQNTDVIGAVEEALERFEEETPPPDALETCGHVREELTCVADVRASQARALGRFLDRVRELRFPAYARDEAQRLLDTGDAVYAELRHISLGETEDEIEQRETDSDIERLGTAFDEALERLGAALGVL